ncbi:ABC transporter permease subunit [Fredinandcohnia sp. QZ13]|uniref:ABC transporter permease subunit n=1 Tax=Fredinandcohnia sp. QZ13 TaxID=3073144 RepID=UPI00285337E3|nr:ABC transporter permease subunit [Fredinandcohnia sp. QZ13]MDR4888046.1 ABC transporter permease subunit [Fredinandcohnia sp. QZ13]
MNVFFHEVRAYRKTTIIWTLSLVGVMALFMSMFPTIAKDIEEYQKVLDGFPDAMKQALGLQMETFGSVLGFYSYVFVYISLCGAIQAMNFGTAIVSKEVREKTADFLLTKPITRKAILTAKMIAAFTSILFTSLVFIVAAWLVVAVVATDDYSIKAFFLISLSLLLLQVIFLGIGIFLSVFLPKIKSVLSVSLGTVFAFFIIGMLSSTGGDELKRYLSPFKYFDSSYIMEHTSYEGAFLLAGLGIVLFATIASFFYYTKKDIHSV